MSKPATLLIGLAAIGTKVASHDMGGGGEAASLGLAALLVTEFSAVLMERFTEKNLDALQEKFDEWRTGLDAPHNHDLEDALARSAIRADLFTLRKSDPAAANAHRGGWFRRLCVRWFTDVPRGFHSRGAEPWLSSALDHCQRRLKELQETGARTNLDATRLSVIDDKAYAAQLAGDALKALEATCGEAPENVRRTFEHWWVYYLWLNFTEELKTKPRAETAFTLLRDATSEKKILDKVESKGNEILEELRRGRSGTERPDPPLDPPPPLDPGLVVGRDEFVGRICGPWLENRSKPLLIWGPPGIGKSTSILKLLQEPAVLAKFGGRRFHLRCDEFLSAEALMAGMDFQWFRKTEGDHEASVLRGLGSGPAAVAIDNFETPWREDAAPCEDWLARLAGVKDVWLMVGMQGHRIPGNLDFDRHEPPSLSEGDARLLFRNKAGMAEGESLEPVWEQLMGEMEGIPHAIALLGAQARYSEPADVRRRWDTEKTRFLSEPGARDRYRSLFVAYELAVSNPRLNGGAQLLLRGLACLPAGAHKGDLATLFPLPGEGGGTVQQAAADLQRDALAFLENDRLRMLAPLRAHLANRAMAGEQTGLMRYFLRLGCRGEESGTATGGEIAPLLAAEAANIEWSIRLAQSQGETAMDACRGMAEFGGFSGLGGTALLALAIRMANRAGDLAAEARGIQCLGDIALRRSDHDAARSAYERALPLYQKVGAVLGEANCIQRLGDIALGEGAKQLAAQKFREALALYRKIREPYSSGTSLVRLARLENQQSKRREMIAEIVLAWQGIDRQDLVDGLAREFPKEVQAAGKG